jgi:uncharacterized delta-60 repeat protein
MVQDSFGKILVGGEFTSYNGVPVNSLVRLNLDGSIDTTFNPPMTSQNQIFSIAQDNNNKIYVTDGLSLKRLNYNGSEDTSFIIGNLSEGIILDILVDSNQKIYVAGFFGTYNSISSIGIIRLNSDGTHDNSFASPFTTSGPVIVTLFEDSSERIYIAGNLPNRLARLNSNGSIDATFDTGTGFLGAVLAISEDSSDKLYIGGAFTSYNGQAVNRIISLNDNGSVNENFVIGTGLDASVNKLIVLSNGDIAAAGNFTIYNTVSSNRFVLLNPNGSLDETFDMTLPIEIPITATVFNIEDGISINNNSSRRDLPTIMGTLDYNPNGGTTLEKDVINSPEVPTTYLLVSASLSDETHIARLRLYSVSASLNLQSELTRSFDVEASSSAYLIADMILSGSQTTYFAPKIIGANLENMGTNLENIRGNRELINGKKEIYYILENKRVGAVADEIEVSLHVFSLED